MNDQADLLPDEAAELSERERGRLTDALGQWQHAEELAELLGVGHQAVHAAGEHGGVLEGFQVVRAGVTPADRAMGSYWKRRRYKYRARPPRPDPAIARFAEAHGLRPTERDAERFVPEDDPTPTPATIARALGRLLDDAATIARDVARYLEA